MGAADFESPSPPPQRLAPLLIRCFSASSRDHLVAPASAIIRFSAISDRVFCAPLAALPNFDLGDHSSSCSRIRPSECQDENVMRIYFVKASEQ